MTQLALKMLEIDEGWEARPYRCSEGYPTIGFGFKIGGKADPLPQWRLPKSAGRVWLADLVSDIENETAHITEGLSEVRKSVIICMAYQLGVTGLLGFKRMLSAVDRRAFGEAAEEMLDSKWAMQTPARAQRLAHMMQWGTEHPYYQ